MKPGNVKLSEVNAGSSVILAEFGNTALHLQLLAMGIGPGTAVTLIRRLPLHGNLYLQIGTRKLVIRFSEAEQLKVKTAA